MMCLWRFAKSRIFSNILLGTYLNFMFFEAGSFVEFDADEFGLVDNFLV